MMTPVVKWMRGGPVRGSRQGELHEEFGTRRMEQLCQFVGRILSPALSVNVLFTYTLGLFFSLPVEACETLKMT